MDGSWSKSLYLSQVISISAKQRCGDRISIWCGRIQTKHLQQPIQCRPDAVAIPWRWCLAVTQRHVPPEEPHDDSAVDTSSAQPLPKVLGGEDILMYRTGPVPAGGQVLCKLLQNCAKRVPADSPSNARTAEQIF